MANTNRPLSPHLTVYKAEITMAMSIMHRITGVALYFGTALVVFFLACAAMGADTYALAQWVFNSWFGRFILFGYTWALFHHMLGGMRHFVWDLGKGFGRERYMMSLMTLIGSVILTILLWLFFI